MLMELNGWDRIDFVEISGKDSYTTNALLAQIFLCPTSLGWYSHLSRPV